MMENKKIYLGSVNKDFELTKEVLKYFQSREIQVIKYFENIGVLKLQAEKDLMHQKLKYVEHIEKDENFSTNRKID